MITDGKKKALVALSTISLFTTVFGNLMPNLIFNFGKKSYLFDTSLSWRKRLIFHDSYGVCGIGLITGALLVLLLIIQVSLLDNLDNKDINGRKNLATTTLIIILLYFFIQLFANSYLSHKSRNYDPKIGLWEFMLPTYFFQFIILCILFSE